MQDLTADHYTWTSWNQAYPNADQADRLDALREYIFATAESWVDDCTYDAAWANKKLAKLGITARITRDSYYALTATVTATMEVGISARSRAEALEKYIQQQANGGSRVVIGATATSDPVFTDGPEDSDGTVDADAPQTVDATLVVLREIILLGHIAGPKICEAEANKALASFGLEPIPPRKKFTVTRPVEGLMRTTVEAYDEASANRVASWRWDNGRNGYDVVEADTTSPAFVVAVG